MADKIITFQVAYDNFYSDKKIVFSPSNKCMTKAEVISHINCDESLLTSYVSNRLVPISKVIPIGGINNLAYQFNDDVYCVHQLPAGKLLVGGRFTQYRGTTVTQLVRLNSDGTLDTTFNTGTGFATPAYRTTVVNLIELPDNRILVSGQFTQYQGNAVNSLMIISPNGAFDPSLNSASNIYYGAMGDGYPAAIFDVTFLNNFIYIVGIFNNQFPGPLKLNMNGTIVSTFNTNPYLDSLSITTDGQYIYLSGRIFVSGAYTYAVIKLNPTNGSEVIPPIRFVGNIHTIVYDSDSNKLLLGGRLINHVSSGTPTKSITRIDLNGALDTTFNTNITNNPRIVPGPVDVIALDNSGSIYTCINTAGESSYQSVIKVNSNGTNDASFVPDTQTYHYVLAISPNYAGNSVLVGGNIPTYKGAMTGNLVRLDSTNGNLIVTSTNPSTLLLLVDFVCEPANGISFKIKINDTTTEYTTGTSVNLPVAVGDTISVSLNASGSHNIGKERRLSIEDASGLRYSNISSLNLSSGVLTITSNTGIVASLT